MRKYIKTIIALLMIFSFAPAGAYAKSMSMINKNMDYRKSLFLKKEFSVYVKTSADNYPYYGAKFEPRAGIYIGTPYNKTYPGIQNAINTQYDWFVPKDEIKNENCPRNEIPEKKSEHTKLRGINLNFALRDNKVINIREYSNYLYNKLDEYASWGDDILLIFGKEMNIDDNFNDPELFKDCFRFVADYAHTKENIAMVYAPNDLGGLDTTIAEFYPGDEYVDWMGCSLYTMPYFQGRPDGDTGGNLLFAMREYANPSMHAKVVHQFMVDNNVKKPVMITEGGVGYESPDGVDYTEFAKQQYRMYYADICRKYPEFKCIISFNEYVPPGDLYRYDASENPELLPLLQEVTADSIYLKSYPSSAPYSFMEMFDGMIFTDRIELSTYAYVPAKQSLVVTYLIDGKWVSEKTEPPYEVSLTNDHVSYGRHKLTCRVYDGSGFAAVKDYDIEFIPADNQYIYNDETDTGSCIYSDMSDAPSEMKNAVGFLSEKGILNGLDGVNFGPYRKLSRSEMAAILIRFAGIEESRNDCGLSDVTEDDWYCGIINAAVNEGLITGYEDGRFYGGRPVNRYEFAAMAAKLLYKKNGERPSDTELTYKDNIPQWAEGYVKTVTDNSITLSRKDGIFYGEGYISRGDAAVMMKRLYDAVNP